MSPKMASRPFKGALGEKVWVSTCQPCFNEWIHMGTKVIDSTLNFADPRHTPRCTISTCASF